MAAKSKVSPDQWASTLATCEADPRKPLAWLIDELGLPVGAEALRLWKGKKRTGMVSKGGAKVAKPKLGKSEAAKPHKPKKTPVKPNKCDVPLAGEAVTLEVPAGPDLDVTKLPLRWQVFFEEYLIDFNGTPAAI